MRTCTRTYYCVWRALQAMPSLVPQYTLSCTVSALCGKLLVVYFFLLDSNITWGSDSNGVRRKRRCALVVRLWMWPRPTCNEHLYDIQKLYAIFHHGTGTSAVHVLYSLFWSCSATTCSESRPTACGDLGLECTIYPITIVIRCRRRTCNKPHLQLALLQLMW